MEGKAEYTITLAGAKVGRCHKRVMKCYGSMEEGQGDLSVGEGKGENLEQYCLVDPSAVIEMF